MKVKVKRTSAEKIAKAMSVLAGAQLNAARNLHRVVSGEHPDAHVPWNEASTQIRASMLLAQGSMAAERAKTVSEAPRSLGIVVVAARLEDTAAGRAEWELNAAKLKEQRSIEAVVTPKESNGTS